MEVKRLAVLVVFAISVQCLSGQTKEGDKFELWTEGNLDIHHINTGKGECAFFILPDGTTMLVDAGATGREKPRVTDARPDDSRSPGEWISRYIGHMMQQMPATKLDYMLLTHFHDDHMGTVSPGMSMSATGNYILSGITEVGDRIPFGKLVDRGYPDYCYPSKLSGRMMENYHQFISYQTSQKGAKVERFIAGSNRQITLVNNPARYADFEVRILAVNGEVWTGTGNVSRMHFPAVESLPAGQAPGENMCSSAFRLSYGKFDYFNGGDLTTGAPGQWQDIETPVAIAAGPVEVCLANHHAYYDAMGVAALQALRPRVHIIQSWAPSHPSPSVLARMMSSWTYPGPRDVFSTNIMNETHTVIGSRVDDMKSRQGHIVIRVAPGGESFMVYILDDQKESFTVKAQFGPYVCN